MTETLLQSMDTMKRHLVCKLLELTRRLESTVDFEDIVSLVDSICVVNRAVREVHLTLEMLGLQQAAEEEDPAEEDGGAANLRDREREWD